jgi:hypothetical protein
MKMAAALRGKEKQLEAARKKPDPMQKEGGLRRDLNKHSSTADTLVRIPHPGH